MSDGEGRSPGARGPEDGGMPEVSDAAARDDLPAYPSAPADIEAYLHRHIPLSRAMAVRVILAGADEVVLEAPLAPNVNHRATAFGGSVASLAVLAGWTLVHLRLREAGVRSRTVIQRSTIAYDAPIHGAFQAVAQAPSGRAWSRLLTMLRRWGRGRIGVNVALRAEGEEVGRFRGAYVAVTSPEA